MKYQFQQVWKTKSRTLANLRNLNNEYISTIYYDLCKKKSIREIHKDIRKVSVAYSDLIIDKNCEKYVYKVAKIIKKKTMYKDIDLLPPIILEYIQQDNVYEQTQTFSYKHAKEEEYKNKINVINEMLEVGTQSPHFYLASMHDDSAEDHVDYQGKLYYDKNWYKYVKDKDTRRVIENLIKNRNMKSIQWVIDRPVWFITRPNCRHYFEPVSLEEVVNTPTQDLVEKLGMHTKVGTRGTNQTIRHPLDTNWYTRKNVEDIIDKYQRRLSFHKAMYRKVPCNELVGYIDKDVRLIKKWKAYLQTHF